MHHRVVGPGALAGVELSSGKASVWSADPYPELGSALGLLRIQAHSVLVEPKEATFAQA